MSYIAYLNFQKIELLNDGKEIAFTKQVNSLSRLDNRQSNFTHKFIAPLTDTNKLVMDNCFIIGNQSNIPYQKNRFDLIDADSGKHLIFDGWANITQTSDKGYEINTYDGIIDFYKEIENKSLTEIGIADLNHVKDLTTIVDSWANTFAYKYIIADYNGKLLTTDNKLNADYLVPSARISYIWDRVHQYANTTYNGTIFQNERFTNLYMTFPKPIPTDEPIIELIANQNSEFQTGGFWYGGLGGYNSFGYSVEFFPTTFSTAYANNSGNTNIINILQTGAYRLTIEGTLSLSSEFTIKEFNYFIVAPDNSIIETGVVDGSINQAKVINLTAGDRLYLSSNNYLALWSGTIESTFELIVGFSANFDEALVDFMAKDFVNDIMQHFGLTAFKDKYTNHIEYLSLDEILQNENIIDWSSKFSNRLTEKYILGTYAQKNNFIYRHNGENETHNNGAIFINNTNLKDQTNIIQSKFYTNELRQTTLLGNSTNVYKMWNKEIKDNGDVNYKDLSGRYYLLRSNDFTYGTTQTIKSEVLNVEQTFNEAPIESYFRLKFDQIIFDNYRTIQSILDKSKLITIEAWLTTLDYESFTFKELVYFKQLGGYFLVNTISNFIKGKKTKIELIEVDYFKQLESIEPIDYVLQIDNSTPIDYTDCEATFTLISDIPIGSDIEIVPYCLTPDGLGGTYFAPYPLATPITANYTGATLTYNFSQLPFMLGGYKFKITYRTSIFEIVESNFSEIVNIDGACYFPIAPTPNLSFITITNVVTTSVVGNRRNVRVSYISDLSVATMTLTLNANGVTLFASLNSLAETFFSAPQNSFVDINLLDNALGEVCQYQITLSALDITSNIAVSQ
jgi:hypothetical protein